MSIVHFTPTHQAPYTLCGRSARVQSVRRTVKVDRVTCARCSHGLTIRATPAKAMEARRAETGTGHE